MVDSVTIGDATLFCGDAADVLSTLPEQSVQCVVTSPPYWGLRDYGVEGQIGLEPDLVAYGKALERVFAQVRRILRQDGTLWLNMGDAYTSGGRESYDTTSSNKSNSAVCGMERRIGGKPKDLIGLPWQVAFMLQATGWYLRSDIIWHKPNPMPESVKDRPTRAHEYIFLLTKSQYYFYDAEAIREPGAWSGKAPAGWDTGSGSHGTTHRTGREKRKHPVPRGSAQPHSGFNGKWDHMTTQEQRTMGRNKRSVWTVATRPFPEAHFATFPEKLIEPCILAGSRAGDVVMDPFMGSGTTGVVCAKHGRRFVGVELNEEYLAMAGRRIDAAQRQGRLPLEEVS